MTERQKEWRFYVGWIGGRDEVRVYVIRDRHRQYFPNSHPGPEPRRKTQGGAAKLCKKMNEDWERYLAAKCAA